MLKVPANTNIDTVVATWFRLLRKSENSKVISGLEFLSGLTFLIENGSERDRLETCFELFDFDKTGVLSPEVLTMLIKTCLQGIGRLTCGLKETLTPLCANGPLKKFIRGSLESLEELNESRALDKETFVQWAKKTGEIQQMITILQSAQFQRMEEPQPETEEDSNEIEQLKADYKTMADQNTDLKRQLEVLRKASKENNNTVSIFAVAKVLGCTVEHARKKCENTSEKVQNRAACRIQSQFRGHIGRVHILKVVRQSKAARVIQRTLRLNKCRRQRKVAIRQMQKAARGRVIRRLSRKKVHASTRIQSMYRGYRCRKHLKRRETAARRIQLYFRRKATVIIDADVEYIVAHRIKGEKYEFKIHWKDSDPAEDEWISREELLACEPDTLLLYEKTHLSDDEECDIEKIVAHKLCRGRIIYRVRWTRASEEEDEWFEREELAEAGGETPSILEQYEKDNWEELQPQ